MKCAAARQVQVQRAAGQSRAVSVRRVARATATSERKTAPLQTGGTLKGDKAAGKDAATKSKLLQITGDFKDERWVNGTWDFAQFAKEDGTTDWDAVIDAEVIRRKWLEQRPEGSDNNAEVTFQLAQIPTWVWIKRFHLPQAELINGRACMVGYMSALLIDATAHVGLVDMQFSFWGKLATFVTVLGCAFIRSTKDIENIQNLITDATFYDSQWQATWEEGVALPEDAPAGPSQQEDLANPPRGLGAKINYDTSVEQIGRKGKEWN